MIRFNCPNCDRHYELPPALAHLPLVCKQCGQRITPPAADPDPPPATRPAAPQAALPVAQFVALPPKPVATKLPGDDDTLVTEPDSAPDGEAATEPEINLGLLGPEPPRPAPRRAARPPEPEVAAPDARPEPAVLPFVADLIVFVLLVVAGVFLGEQLAQKPTGEVLSEAGSAATFPPTDLLLWAAPPVLLALVYLLLGSRERTAGAWLRRRSQ